MLNYDELQYREIDPLENVWRRIWQQHTTEQSCERFLTGENIYGSARLASNASPNETGVQHEKELSSIKTCFFSDYWC